MAILGAVVPAFPQSGPAGVTPVRGVEHGAPLRLLAPVKIGLKNIKAITQISYSVEEPADCWTIRGYSKYQGI
jgi:DMSO/TMAO reductase YedYZ molybdopterin-dependent catalytic subunit